MSEIPNIIETTNIKSVMLRKGVLSKKDFSRIDSIEGEYLCTLVIELMKISTLRGKDTTIQFGVKLEITNSDNNSYSSFLDIDEVPEFVSAIGMIEESTEHMRKENYHYSEMEYSTKDNIKVGLYKDDKKKIQYFLTINSESYFMNSDVLKQISNALISAKEKSEILEKQDA